VIQWTLGHLVTNRHYVAVFCLILLPQFSSHLHESYYTGYIWRVTVHDIWFARFGPELCPFLKLSYPYRELVSQNISNCFQVIFMIFHVFPLTTLRYGIYTSVILPYLIDIYLFILFANDNNICIVSQETNNWLVKFRVTFFFHSLG